MFLEISQKSQEKPVPESLFNKAAGLGHRCFTVNFAKFLRTPFLQNTSGRLLLTTVLEAWKRYVSIHYFPGSIKKVVNFLFTNLLNYSRKINNTSRKSEIYKICANTTNLYVSIKYAVIQSGFKKDLKLRYRVITTLKWFKVLNSCLKYSKRPKYYYIFLQVW